MRHLLLSWALVWVAALGASAQTEPQQQLLRVRDAARGAAGGRAPESAHQGSVAYDGAAKVLQEAPPVQGRIGAANRPSVVAPAATPQQGPQDSGHFSGGYVGLYPESDFTLTTGKKCDGCNAPREGLWYFPDDVIAVPLVGKPAIVWIGSSVMLEGARLSADGKTIRLQDGTVVPFELTPKIASNLSYYDLSSTAFFRDRSLRIRGEWVGEGASRKFVARTIWPEDLRVDFAHAQTGSAATEGDLSERVAKDQGGARGPFQVTVLWQKDRGRAWGGKPVMGLMLNGAQGDDDEAHAGHYSMFTGRFGPNGEMADWMYSNFYGLDEYSEKGIIPALVPMDKYMADVNSGQSWYRPTDILVAVLNDDAQILRIQEQFKDIYVKYYDHSLKFDRTVKPCSSLIIDPLRESGWNVPARGAQDPVSKGLLWALMRVFAGKEKAGGMSDFMDQERTRLFPRAAFEATGADLLRLAGAPGTELERELTDFEKELQRSLEAVLYLRMPQFPSSRAFGREAILDTVDYFHRVPLRQSKWKVGGPTSPRPYPPPGAW